MPPLKQLISELEIALAAATRPTMTRVLRIFPVESRFVSTVHVLTEEPRRAIVAWPQVSHPAVVRAWLGEDAVEWHMVPDGDKHTLSDPEAAGWALAAARALRDGADPDSCEGFLCGRAPDDECERYVRAVCDGVRG